jgi:2'-5' RNA ligase
MRLFVAVNLPDDVRRDIVRAAEPLRAAGLAVKWVDGAGIHVTLKFLGEVARERLGEMAAALDRAAAGARAFPLAVGGFGAFPSPEHARVIWVGCDPAPPLELLQHAVEREFSALGFPVEGRPFRPHITIGRARSDHRGGVRGLAARLAALEFATEFPVRSLDLMESVLSPAGARYAVGHAVPLA